MGNPGARLWRIALIVVGLVMMTGGVVVDWIGLGPTPGMGLKQWVLIVFGGALVFGGFMAGSARSGEKPGRRGNSD